MARLEVDGIGWYMCVYGLVGLQSRRALGARQGHLGGYYLYHHFCGRYVSCSVHTCCRHDSRLASIQKGHAG